MTVKRPSAASPTLNDTGFSSLSPARRSTTITEIYSWTFFPHRTRSNYLFEILWYLQMFPAKSIWADNTPFFDVRGSYDFISALFPACSPLGEIDFQFVRCRDFSFCSTIITNHLMILKPLKFVSLEPQCFARQIPLKIGKEDWPEEEQTFDQPTESLNGVNPTVNTGTYTKLSWQC